MSTSKDDYKISRQRKSADEWVYETSYNYSLSVYGHDDSDVKNG